MLGKEVELGGLSIPYDFTSSTSSSQLRDQWYPLEKRKGMKSISGEMRVRIALKQEREEAAKFEKARDRTVARVLVSASFHTIPEHTIHYIIKWSNNPVNDLHRKPKRRMAIKRKPKLINMMILNLLMMILMTIMMMTTITSITNQAPAALHIHRQHHLWTHRRSVVTAAIEVVIVVAAVRNVKRRQQRVDR
jgi:hypothetical protein